MFLPKGHEMVLPPYPLPKKVLVVDEEPAIRDVLGLALADRGFEVYKAASIAEALELCGQHQPSVVLADLDLTGPEDGQFLADLSRIHPSVRFCLMGAGYEVRTAEEWHRRGVAHYFAKPVLLAQLVTVIEHICAGSNGAG
jgi:DNA-binding NtrC family response regulator